MVAQGISLAYRSPANRDAVTSQVLYTDALQRGRRGQILSGLAGRSRELPLVDEVLSGCTVRARTSGGTRPVPIALILGSENRVGDFDCDFNPLQDHTRDRWLGIASALQRGRHLPPVALIQVGDRYFVRDGHHRISVSRALGWQAITASIEVWQVDQPVASADRIRERRPAVGHRRAGSSRRLGGWLRISIAAAVSGLLGPAGAAGIEAG